jgi:hypothetical protein
MSLNWSDILETGVVGTSVEGCLTVLLSQRLGEFLANPRDSFGARLMWEEGDSNNELPTESGWQLLWRAVRRPSNLFSMPAGPRLHSFNSTSPVE